MPMSDFWTTDRVEQLKKLAVDHTASQIGRILGTTRNACLGKLHRLGLSYSHSKLSLQERQDHRNAWRRQRHAAMRQLEALRSTPPVPPIPPAPVSVLTILELGPGACKWPMNDGKPEYLFCGHTVWQQGKPYCAYHHMLAHERRRA